jgi:hypothetical protein
MVNRAQIMRPVEGGVVHQGWLHPAALPNVKNLFVGREFAVFAPKAIHLPVEQLEQAAASFLAKLWPGRAAPQARFDHRTANQQSFAFAQRKPGHDLVALVVACSGRPRSMHGRMAAGIKT